MEYALDRNSHSSFWHWHSPWNHSQQQRIRGFFMRWLPILMMGFSSMQGISSDQLTKIFREEKPPFSYDLSVKILPNKHKQAPVIICCHGYGANNRIGDCVHSSGVVPDHVVSFNFPDYDCVAKQYDPKKSAFGSINELLPLFYVIKKCVIDARQEKIDLYGFSAGGAAIINMLAVLNHPMYDAQLKEIGINQEGKEKIRTAIQNGIIILDCPMKSAEEIISACDASEKFWIQEFEILAKRYAANNMRPIDAVQKLEGLHLHILLYIENPDEILGNRDDQLFIDRLKKANARNTEVIIGSYGGHNRFHASLWDRYKKLIPKA